VIGGTAMSKNDTASNSELDPLRIWREWYQKSEKQWSDGLTQLLGNDRIAKSTGKYAQEAVQLQRMFAELIAQGLATLNLPARSDILALSERMGQLEDAMAGVQVEVRQLRRTLTERDLVKADTTLKRPKRTKQPPKKKD
jgi:hypothetical protein